MRRKDPVTINGRLIDRFLNTALANTRLYLDGGRRYADTGADGEFSVSTTTLSLLDSTKWLLNSFLPHLQRR